MNFMLHWLAGSLWGDDWGYITILAPWVLILIGYIFYKARMLNTLHLGNQMAQGLGLAVKRQFWGCRSLLLLYPLAVWPWVEASSSLG